MSSAKCTLRLRCKNTIGNRKLLKVRECSEYFYFEMNLKPLFTKESK